MCMQIVVSYGQDEVNKFIDLADAIEDEFPELQVEGQEIEQDQQDFTIQTEDGKILAQRKPSEPFPEAANIIGKLRDAGFA